MQTLKIFIMIVVSIFGVNCSSEQHVKQKKEQIGSVKMEVSGSIILHLRAEGEGTLGDGYFVISEDDSRYNEIIERIGGIKLGEEKPYYLKQE